MNLAVILAAPRSGSTYLQNLLSMHPRIASPQETHLFNNYLVPLLKEWDRQHAVAQATVQQLAAGETPEHRLIGLPTIVEDDEFDRWLTMPLAMMMAQTLAAKPTADLVVEKTPSNSLVPREIARLSPDAKFVHLVRDPKDVIASQLGARGWGGDWADISVQAAAWRWNEHVSSALGFAAGGADVLLVRYEQLMRDPGAVLTEVLEFLGRPVAAADVRDMVDKAGRGEASYAFTPSIKARLGSAQVTEPAGFARRPGETRRTLSALEQSVARTVTYPLAAELGYATEQRRPGVGARLALRAEQVQRRTGALRTRLGQGLTPR